MKFDPDSMLYLIAIVALVIVAASLFADYKWRKWMKEQKHEHDNDRS